MIKIENENTYGWEAAIRGMRNPMNSWDKSDTVFTQYNPVDYPAIGENDLNLMKKLAAAGNDHGKYLRMITVTCDITAPLYWWKEFDTYKVGTVANSCSTMHKIHAKDFTLDDFSHDHLGYENEYLGTGGSMNVLNKLVEYLNWMRKRYIETQDKYYWWQMIQLLPTSYNQRRTVQMNYAVLRNIYPARKNHKLDEWINFCIWAETLPYAELITGRTS